MPRPVRLAAATGLVLALSTAAAQVSIVGHPVAAHAGERVRPTVRARLTGWVERRDGFYLYRQGATVRLVVGVWPNLQGELVRARLEWRRSGTRWRLIEVSSVELNRDSRALFLVRRLPEGSSFRIRARMPPGDGHRAGRSPWRYFRAV